MQALRSATTLLLGSTTRNVSMAESRIVLGYVDPNFPNPMTESSATIIIYGYGSKVMRWRQHADTSNRYTPSLAVGVLGVVLFAIGLAAHLLLLLRHRTWYFSTVVVGTVMEIVGYAFRILSSQQNPYSVPWFVVQVSACSIL
jgi:hypothetical protein